MRISIRLHDAVDPETVLGRLLPVLAGTRGERRVAYASLNAATGRLDRRWSTTEGGGVESAPLDLEPERLHSLLPDDALGDRPLRPADSAPSWALRDLLPGLDADRFWVRARAVAHDDRWLGVLVVAEPRRWMLPRRGEESTDAGGDVLEMCLARAIILQERGAPEPWPTRAPAPPPAAAPHAAPAAATAPVADGARLREAEAALERARAADEETRRRTDALEEALARATELLMEAHVEMDRRAQRHQRQTRVLYLLRRMLESPVDALSAERVASDVVRTVSEAFGGGRCSLLLIDERGADVPHLRMAAAVGLPPSVDVSGLRVALDSGVSGQVARSRAPVVVREPAEGAPHALVGDEFYTGPAFVSLPLLCRSRLLGVLNVTNFRSGTVDDYEVEQLRLVALCVALLVEHAALGERLFAPRMQAAG